MDIPKKMLSLFSKAISKYRLLSPGDYVLVCISGGSSSCLMAKLFAEYAKRPVDMRLCFAFLSGEADGEDTIKISGLARSLGLPIEIFPGSDIFSVAASLNCNKIALAHCYDDVIETILSSLLYCGSISSLIPKLKIKEHENTELIRPMYLIRRSQIESFWEGNTLNPVSCPLLFETGENNKEPLTQRKAARLLIDELKKTNPFIERNLFSCTENINLSTLMGYIYKNKAHFFLDDYDSLLE